MKFSKKIFLFIFYTTLTFSPDLTAQESKPDCSPFIEPTSFNTKTTLLFEDKPGTSFSIRDEDWRVAPNGRYYVFSYHGIGTSPQNRGIFINLAGKQYGPFSTLTTAQFVFSPNGDRVATLLNKGSLFLNKTFIDGKQKFGKVEQLVLSPKLCEAAFVVSSNKQEKIIAKNKRVGKAFEAIRFPAFSPNGKTIAYLAAKNIGECRRLEIESPVGNIPLSQCSLNNWYLFINEKQFGPYPIISEFSFSQDGRQLAFLTVESSLKDEKDKVKNSFLFLNVYDVLEEKLTNIKLEKIDANNLKFAPALLFSPDDRRIAFTFRDKGKNFLGTWSIEEGVVKIKGNVKDVKGLTFSPDGKKLAWIQQKGKKDVLIEDGREFSPCSKKIDRFVYTTVGKPIVLCDEGEGKTSAFARKYSLSVGSKKGKVFEAATSKVTESPLLISPNGEQVGLIAQERQSYEGYNHLMKFILLNGKRGKSYHQIRDVSFSPDSSVMAYVAKDYVVGKKGDNGKFKSFIVINGQEEPAYDYIQRPVFSSDGKYLGYGARKNNQLWWVVKKM